MLRVALSFVILKHIEDLAVIMKIAKKYLCVSKLSDWATGKEEKTYLILLWDLKAGRGWGKNRGVQSPARHFASC